MLKKKALTSGKVVSGYSELLKYLSFLSRGPPEIDHRLLDRI